MHTFFVSLVAFFAGMTACGAQSITHMAENNVQVAMVKVVRMPQHTEVQLETRAALKGVCWYFQGPNSPYLIAADRRYRFMSGERITNCPQKRDYASGETMILRFQPLPAHVRQFSMVEGEGGENQMADPASRRNETFWNFLRVKVD